MTSVLLQVGGRASWFGPAPVSMAGITGIVRASVWGRGFCNYILAGSSWLAAARAQDASLAVLVNPSCR